MISFPSYRPVLGIKADSELNSVEAEKARWEELARVAQQEAQKKQAEAAQKRADAVRSISASADQVKKELARERIRMIKERIEALLQMLAMFGGKGAKAMLQELKQLSNELRQAAAVLNSSSSGSDPAEPQAAVGATGGAASASAPAEASATQEQVPTVAVETEGRQAYAEQQASADADAAGANADAGADDGKTSETKESHGIVPAEKMDAQRLADERLIEEVKRKLEALRVMAERMAKQEDEAQARGKRLGVRA